MITVSSTDIQNNFEKYLKLVQNGEEVIIFVIRGAAELLFKGVVRN